MPGLPLAPGPWLVAFVDHVATEYPISVFDAHFRPPEPPAAPLLNPALPNARVSPPAAPPLNPVLPEKWDRGRE